MTGSRKGKPVRELGKGARRRHLAKGDASGQSTRDSRETSRHEIGSSHCEEDRSG